MLAACHGHRGYGDRTAGQQRDEDLRPSGTDSDHVTTATPIGHNSLIGSMPRLDSFEWPAGL